MNFTKDQKEIAKIYFGLNDNLIEGLPETMDIGLISLSENIQKLEDLETRKKAYLQLTQLVSLFSLISAKILDEAYDNPVTEAMFYLASEAIENNSKLYDSYSKEVKEKITLIISELKGE